MSGKTTNTARTSAKGKLQKSQLTISVAETSDPIANRKGRVMAKRITAADYCRPDGPRFYGVTLSPQQKVRLNDLIENAIGRPRSIVSSAFWQIEYIRFFSRESGMPNRSARLDDVYIHACKKLNIPYEAVLASMATQVPRLHLVHSSAV